MSTLIGYDAYSDTWVVSRKTGAKIYSGELNPATTLHALAIEVASKTGQREFNDKLFDELFPDQSVPDIQSYTIDDEPVIS